MAKVKVQLNLRGINQLMSSRPVQRVVGERADEIAAKAGPNFEVVDDPHKWTARSFIQAANPEGMREEARAKVLTAALGAAGGLVRYTRKRDGKEIWVTQAQADNWGGR